LRWGSPTATPPFEPLDLAPKDEFNRRSTPFKPLDLAPKDECNRR